MGKRTQREPEVISVPEEKNIWGKRTLVLVLLVLGAYLITNGLIGMFRKQSGWNRIETKRPLEYSDEILFYYDLGEKRSAEYRVLTEIYTEALSRSHDIFSLRTNNTGLRGLRMLNDSPNVAVEVEPELYSALETFSNAGCRDIFLAPVYRIYGQLFVCMEDYETAGLDPARDRELKGYVDNLLSFINDPGAVDIELLGNNTVRLNMSEEYVRFCEENGITDTVDFFWYTNAVIVDCIADVMADRGLTDGFIQSKDNFVRCLDGRDKEYRAYVYNREGNIIRDVADLVYRGHIAMASLRDYTDKNDVGQPYYEYSDGTTVTPYISISDGLSHCSVTDIVVYSHSGSCTECAIQAAGLIRGDSFDPDRLQEGFEYVYTADRTVHSSDPDVRLENIFDKDGVRYSFAAD